MQVLLFRIGFVQVCFTQCDVIGVPCKNGSNIKSRENAWLNKVFLKNQKSDQNVSYPDIIMSTQNVVISSISQGPPSAGTVSWGA